MNRTRLLLVLTGLFALRTAVGIAHGQAHSMLAVPLEPWQNAFVQLVIFWGPLVLMVWLWLRPMAMVAWMLAGLLTVGGSIPDAFLSMYTFENTCRIQIDAQAGGGELTPVDPRILAGMAEVMKIATAGQGAMLAWPALLRKLDRSDPSYKT